MIVIICAYFRNAEYSATVWVLRAVQRLHPNIVVQNILAGYSPVLAHLKPPACCLGNIIEFTPEIINSEKSGVNAPVDLLLPKVHTCVAASLGVFFDATAHEQKLEERSKHVLTNIPAQLSRL